MVEFFWKKLKAYPFWQGFIYASALFLSFLQKSKEYFEKHAKNQISLLTKL